MTTSTAHQVARGCRLGKALPAGGCFLFLCFPEPYFRPHAKQCFATATGKTVIKFEGRLRRWPRPKRVWRRRGDALTLALEKRQCQHCDASRSQPGCHWAEPSERTSKADWSRVGSASSRWYLLLVTQ